LDSAVPDAGGQGFEAGDDAYVAVDSANDVAGEVGVAVDGAGDGPPTPDSGPIAPPPALKWHAEGVGNVNYGIWGSGPDDIYAVGASGFIEHFTGGQWMPQMSGTSAILFGVWGSGAGDIYVAAYINTILHSVGDGTWQHEALPSGTTFQGVWGSGPNDVYVYYGAYVHSTGGGIWSPVEQVTMDEVVTSMWGSSATDVWAAGDITHVYHSRGEGTGWTAQAPGGQTFVGVGGSGPNDIYAASSKQMFHSTGNGTWQQQPLQFQFVNVLTSVWALSPQAVYATSAQGSVFRSSGDGTWTEQVIARGLGINAIWGTSPTNLYLATAGGVWHGTP
jgi:hypothetical protein